MQEPTYPPFPRLYRNKMWRSIGWRIYYLGLTALYFGNLVWAVWRHDAYGTVLWTVLLVLFLGTWWQSGQTLLVASNDGLTYHANGYVLVVRWEDVAGFGRPPEGSWRVSHGLLLRDWQWWPRRGWGGLGYRNVGFIPLRYRSMGTPYWDSGIENELSYYAPWIFPAYQSPPGIMQPPPAADQTAVHPQ